MTNRYESISNDEMDPLLVDQGEGDLLPEKIMKTTVKIPTSDKEIEPCKDLTEKELKNASKTPQLWHELTTTPQW